ncbi:unnamed protein product [Heligmosomoides polygyrus]|uniref:Transthyretin-like family protein n=1 Tax=Heligmosomoides polygyrus TaxID=6339 RepID=A0A3P8AB86_HELPZ|nr:unnamed protein product [Heligmosomoides polygyrus]
MHSIVLVVITLPACVAALFGFIGREQSVAVSGRLICNGIPASGVKVKLYEKELTFDTKLAESRTDSNGEFMLSGSKREVTNIDPKVNIYHKCNYNGFCYKKLSITIPDNFITDGIAPSFPECPHSSLRQQASSEPLGRIWLSGSKRKITDIDPIVNIYHRCNYRGPCYKKLSVTIPMEFITSGPSPHLTYNIGSINLASWFKGETIDCFNRSSSM